MTPKELFRRNNRLKTNSDFLAVYKEGSSFVKRPFVFKILKGRKPDKRIGFSIGSRVIKLSNKRFRIRRVLKEAFRKNTSRIKSGTDIVVIARGDPGSKFGYRQAEELLLAVAKDAGVLL